MRLTLAITLAFGLGFFASNPVQAATYTYEGDPYLAVFNAFADPGIIPYDASMRMRITLEVPTPLTRLQGLQFLKDTVTTFRFSDDVQTLDQSNSVLDMLTLRFDASGNIAEWQMIAKTLDAAPANLTSIGRAMSSSGSPDFFGRDLSTNGRCQLIGANGICEESIINSAFTTGTQNEWTMRPDAPTPIPLPSPFVLLAAALALLVSWSRLQRLAPVDS